MFWPKLIRNLSIGFFLVLIIINFVYWAHTVEIGANFEFRGFYWFFTEISTFQPLSATIGQMQHLYDMIKNVANVAMSEDWWDVVISVLRVVAQVLILPFNLTFTILKDLFNIIMFVFRLLGVDFNYV